MDAKTKLSKARAQLMLDKRFIFWATVGLYQKPVVVSDGSMAWRGGEPTMATDGRHLYYSESFVDKCPLDELKGVLAHEAGHCALGHHLRRQARNPIAWNVAADFALNPLLMKAGLKLPKDCLYDKKWEGMASEEIYANIPVKYMKMTGSGFGCGGVIDDPNAGKSGEDAEKQWEVIIRQAAQIAKGQGHLPGDFEYLLEPIKPKLDLHSMLRHMISVVKEDDYTWAKPNRRHVWQDMYLPSQRTESVGDVLVGVDTSGSISKEDAQRFIGVVNVVIEDLKPRTVYLVQCDAEVSDIQEFHSGETLPGSVGIKGCGGTDMRPIFEYAKEHNLNPACAIICSDFQMDKDSFGEKQDYPVLWVTCSNDVEAPWGQTARLED